MVAYQGGLSRGGLLYYHTQTIFLQHLKDRCIFSTVKINLVDAPRALIGDLSEQSLPFDLHHRGISMDDDFVVLRVLSDKI